MESCLNWFIFLNAQITFLHFMDNNKIVFHKIVLLVVMVKILHRYNYIDVIHYKHSKYLTLVMYFKHF